MIVSVIGLGLIGGSMALDLKAQGFADSVWGFDQSLPHQEEALSLGLVDKIVSLEDCCQKADLVILATPVSVMEDIAPQVLSLAGPETTFTDVGSTKARLAQAISQHAHRNQFVLSHPMAGTEFSGPKAAHRGLFEGKAAVICDAEKNDTIHLDKITRMYQALKMRVIMMDSKSHDLHAAYVSHLSHISSFVLANTVLDKEKDVNAIFNLASAGFESTVRLAKSSPEMWAPIFDHNRDLILEALDAYIERLKTFKQKIQGHDFEGTKLLMQDANKIKRVLAQIQNKGKANG